MCVCICFSQQLSSHCFHFKFNDSLVFFQLLLGFREKQQQKKNSYEIIGMSSIINNRLQHHSHRAHNHINYSIVNVRYLLSIFSLSCLHTHSAKSGWNEMTSFELSLWFGIGPLFRLKSTSSACLPSRILKRLTNCLLSRKHHQSENECDLLNPKACDQFMDIE